MASLRALDLEASIGAYDRREGLVWVESGDDNKKSKQLWPTKAGTFLSP